MLVKCQPLLKVFKGRNLPLSVKQFVRRIICLPKKYIALHIMLFGIRLLDFIDYLNMFITANIYN
jgi:hypothetical protein